MDKKIAEEYIKVFPRLSNIFAEIVKDSEGELSHLEAHVIDYLGLHDGSSITEIAKSYSLQKQQLTSVVRDMETKQLIEKVRDPNDKRAYKIQLADAGKKLNAQKWEEAFKRFSGLISVLNIEEKEDLFYALRKINHLFSKLEGVK